MSFFSPFCQRKAILKPYAFVYIHQKSGKKSTRSEGRTVQIFDTIQEESLLIHNLLHPHDLSSCEHLQTPKLVTENISMRAQWLHYEEESCLVCWYSKLALPTYVHLGSTTGLFSSIFFPLERLYTRTCAQYECLVQRELEIQTI